MLAVEAEPLGKVEQAQEALAVLAVVALEHLAQ
jgi:hypothetical protein